MPRRARITPGGLVYHVLNRSVAGLPLFRKQADFEAFERMMIEAHERHPIRILSWCLMRNHWHIILWPRKEGEVTAFMRWLSHTHAMRSRVANKTVGQGPLYQGRFKAFPVQKDEHFLSVCRYVERNALSAHVVKRAQDWRWGSLWARLHGDQSLQSLLSQWPLERPKRWTSFVNRPIAKREVEAIQTSISRNRPYGDERWQAVKAKQLGLTHTMRREGRPRKKKG